MTVVDYNSTRELDDAEDGVAIPVAMIGDVSVHAFAFYGLFKYLFGDQSPATPSQQEIAEKSGRSLATVRRLLKELDGRGWILSERQSEVHGPNGYFICDAPFVKPAQVDAG